MKDRITSWNLKSKYDLDAFPANPKSTGQGGSAPTWAARLIFAAPNQNVNLCRFTCFLNSLPPTIYSLFPFLKSPNMFKSLLRRRNVAILTGATGGGVVYYYFRNGNAAYGDPKTVEDTKRYSAPTPWTPPSRNETLERLKVSSKNKDGVFDLLVIGGGATGAGVALDAATRGLRVALVEQNDFSSGMCVSGTSPRASLWSRT
jgi:hypothetical protein